MRKILINLILAAAAFVQQPAQQSMGPITASINTQINVQSYGAKGDCSTNDTAAVAAAQTVAISYAVGNSLPATLYFPKPTGGCYIVSNLTYKGVSLEGQPSGLASRAPAANNVTLKSLPGQDILHIPDPTTTAGTTKVYYGWSIRNISFLLDNSSSGSFTHRWPGRWFDDGAMTSGSAVFNTSNGNGALTCGDVGQAIQVNGAGPAGVPLVTTIASIYPCWISPTQPSWARVTLAAAASTTVSAAHSYISVLGLPVTQHIGAAAIAQDERDGNSANWVGTLDLGFYGRLENVVFNTTNGSTVASPNGYTAAIFTQGQPTLYGLDAQDVGVFGTYFGISQTTAELSSFLVSSSGDFEAWRHGLWSFNVVPWLSYNGLAQHFEDIQITGPAGPIVLQIKNQFGDYAIGWNATNMSFESPTLPSTYGWRLNGNNHNFAGVALTSTAPGQIAFWDAASSGCVNCGFVNTNLNGVGNKIYVASVPTGLVEGGFNNVIYANYNGNPLNGIPSNYDVALAPFKGYSPLVGRFSGDSGTDENGSVLYNHDDLIIWPRDLYYSDPSAVSPWSGFVAQDATSVSGAYMILTPAQTWQQFNQFVSEGNHSANSIVLGTNLPLTGVTVNLTAKCPGGTTSFVAKVGASGGTTGTQSFSCSASYQNYTFSFAWAGGDSGKAVYIGSDATSPGNVYVASWQLVPWRTSLNGKAIKGAGPAVVTGPTTSALHNCPWFTDTIGTTGDSGNPCAGSAGAPTWYNVVTQGALDNTGAADIGSALATIISGLSSSSPRTLFFPAGTYKLNGGLHISATATTGNGIRIVGEGRDSVTFTSTCTNGYVFWYENTTNSGDNFNGAMFSDFTIDGGGSAACADGIRLTQTAENVIERVHITNMPGNNYSTGTLGISGATVTGVGTTWTAAMVPGVLQVAGVMAEVCAFTDATHLSLCDSAWPKGTISTGTSYAIAYMGRALTFDPGFSFTQYITVHDLFVSQAKFCVYSIGTSSGGNSRITIDGKAGWCGWSGSRNTNSVGIWLGKHSDTFEVHIPVNNMSRGAVLDSAHANNFDGFEIENNGTVTPVTTCNGGVASQACLFGLELTADAGSTGYGNTLRAPYVYQAGDAVHTDNVNGARNLTITGLRSDTFSNINSYSFNGTTGCPANGTAATAGTVTILDWDCVHIQTSAVTAQ